MQILINNKQHALGQPLPAKITSCYIILDPVEGLMRFHPSQLPLVKQWFNTLIDNANCEYYVVNNTYYRVEELTKFTDIKDN